MVPMVLSKHWGMKNAQIVSVGEPQGKKPVARNRPRWKYIKIEFKEIGWEN